MTNFSETTLPGAPHVVFNPYDFLMGTTGQLPSRKFSPIYRTPPFWSLLNLNTYIEQQPVPKEKLGDRSAMYAQLAKALSFVSFVCQESDASARSGRGRYRMLGRKESQTEFLRSNHYACEACIKLISLLPHSAGASGQQLDALFINFLKFFDYFDIFIDIFEETKGTVFNMVMALVNRDYGTAAAMQTALVSSDWKSHKDWLKGMKVLIQLASRKLSAVHPPGY